MKNTLRTFSQYFIICIAVVTTSDGCKKSSGNYSGSLNAFKRYAYERFHLTYEYTGDIRGTEELFASGYGKYEARHSKFDIFSPKGVHQSDNGSITRITDVYTVDYTLRSIAHEHVAALDSIYHLEADDIPTPQTYLESQMKKNYFKNAGIDTIAGKPATRWQQSDNQMTLWIWNGILLRRYVTSPEGSLDLKITDIDTLWAVDTTKFAIPTGFTITEGRQQSNASAAN
jgi:hypothetical protein